MVGFEKQIGIFVRVSALMIRSLLFFTLRAKNKYPSSWYKRVWQVAAPVNGFEPPAGRQRAAQSKVTGTDAKDVANLCFCPQLLQLPISFPPNELEISFCLAMR
jgi:hypothetical protein